MPGPRTIGHGRPPVFAGGQLKLFSDHPIGGGIMILGRVTEIVCGINAEGKSLEDVTKPISSTSNRAAPAAGDPTPTTT